ncbi:hypothetical protein Pan97_07120 [Bremerella volcania]|uniref:Sugar-specific transcriptional regulator TrmB n=1 Tax=Bremerella volcania TaxID=2527984 RepID=A0A518C3C0_9BACT|nr:winged helix-turn-helix domain-containing protein [Bremerella volcania]QDU73713.1 hypothetical protein Pan97_07120 [Bremerella volcania]
MAVNRKKTSRASNSSKSSGAVQTRLKKAQSPVGQEHSPARWTFLTNHSHVLILLSRNPSMVLRQVAIEVGITERAVQRIIADLEECGVIRKEKVGRQNHYFIMGDQPLRHPVEAHKSIKDLLELLADDTNLREGIGP